MTFIFIGAGYAGVEALAELADLVRDALRYYRRLREVEQRWVLVDAAPKILPEIPTRLGDYAARELAKRGVDIRVGTTLDSLDAEAATLSDGERIERDTLVWTAGVKATPTVGLFGLPLDEKGRVIVDPTLKVEGRENVWSLGDCARVPNAATPGQFDPPTCQHALPQVRRLAKNIVGEPKPYRYPMLGQVATLGRRRPRPALPRFHRLVHHPRVPPLPAAAAPAEAPRRHGLDRQPLLPPRHRRALDARPGPARR